MEGGPWPEHCSADKGGPARPCWCPHGVLGRGGHTAGDNDPWPGDVGGDTVTRCAPCGSDRGAWYGTWASPDEQ
jgi:hypothetical protein